MKICHAWGYLSDELHRRRSTNNLMSQNRQSAKDRLHAELDLQTNLKAETMIEELHGGMDDQRIQKWSELLTIQRQQIEMLTLNAGRAGAYAAST